MMMPDTGKYANTISMAWTPDHGLHNMGWSGYNEALFLIRYLLREAEWKMLKKVTHHG